ncbi:hypothetical protein L1887_57155 [Cichorium endivia]|nr:hypothetical protein L1887_57155 [Cichorium endivia]
MGCSPARHSILARAKGEYSASTPDALEPGPDPSSEALPSKHIRNAWEHRQQAKRASAERPPCIGLGHGCESTTFLVMTGTHAFNRSDDALLQLAEAREAPSFAPLPQAKSWRGEVGKSQLQSAHAEGRIPAIWQRGSARTRNARALGEGVRLGRRVQALAHAAAPPPSICINAEPLVGAFSFRQRASPRSLGKAAADRCNSAPIRSVMPA